MRTNKEHRIYVDSLQNMLFLNEIYRLSESKEYKKKINEPSMLKGNWLLVNTAAVLFAVGFPLLTTYYLVCNFIWKRRKNNPDCTIVGKRVFLSFLNSALYRLASSKRLINDDDVWVLGHNETIDGVRNLSMYSFVSYGDLIKAFFVSLVSYYQALSKYGIKVAFLGLSTYDWHVRYQIGMNIPIECELIFCNHMEQNAVLIDALPHKHKTLIQHGTLLLLHNSHSIQWPLMIENKDLHYWTYNVPRKYSTIEKVYAFSEKEYHALCDSILTNRPQLTVIGYGLKTYEVEGGKKTVLIIGLFRKYGDKEEELIQSLQGLDINLILKNHPTQDVAAYDALKKRYHFTLLNDSRFPKAEVVISYDSTLALEYSDCGTKVYYYEDYDVKEIVTEVKGYL